MKLKEPSYLEIALTYKKRYKECSWWRFKKRNYLKCMWHIGMDLMIIKSYS